ncbi:MAG: RagB/SusD family nutrient uptake outer membrane protein [Bacteroidales bacterium]|jgi:hypothetical protein|nr:RagB/SusD family nutrient uptake outer membrane protein [Bacteroidales bacterium]
MKNAIFQYTVYALMTLSVMACNDFLEVDPDNVYNEESVLERPKRAEGILLNAYLGLPSSVEFSDVATDDAVSNLPTNSYRRAANGEWSASYDPFSRWSNAYDNIAYLNIFLDHIVNEVEWAPSNEWQTAEYRKRLAGEAYGLRAFYYWQLLQAHAGIGVSGQLLGVPMIRSADIDRNTLLPRNPYEECVRWVMADIDSAVAFLPDIYADAPTNDPQKSDMDAVYGARYKNRMNARIAKMIRARVLLQAASPAFNPNDDKTKWAAAADAAAEVIDAAGGLGALNGSRLTYYLDAASPEHLWRKDPENIRAWETTHFPPSFFGNGRLNPSQNLIDAFPAANGYPITDAAHSGYNPADPYEGRDARLKRWIIHHGLIFKTIAVNTIDDMNDGVGKVAEKSTRTGYYIRKLMNENVKLDPGAGVSQNHVMTLMRQTEAFLIYAEAANRAWGPDGAGTHSYSAREVIAGIRSTAGIATDPYLASLTDQQDMETLIRNERRLELCFENARFWDIRRWNDPSALTATVYGTSDGGKTFFSVESRNYQPHMIYGPIPYTEMMKELEQNKGW